MCQHNLQRNLWTVVLSANDNLVILGTCSTQDTAAETLETMGYEDEALEDTISSWFESIVVIILNIFWSIAKWRRSVFVQWQSQLGKSAFSPTGTVENTHLPHTNVKSVISNFPGRLVPFTHRRKLRDGASYAHPIIVFSRPARPSNLSFNCVIYT